jgi:hypothetical protein
VDDLGEPGGVIPIGLVGPKLQCSIGLTSVNADDGQPSAMQLVPKPNRQGPGLDPDAFKTRCVSAEE